MIPLLLGVLLFVGIHLLPAQTSLRNGLIARYGAAAYKALFSIVSFAGLVLIVLGFHKAQMMPGKNPVLWQPPLWGRHVTMALMLPVFPLLIATYLRGRISVLVRHPMITAVMLWSAAHLMVRGDAASLLLFGGLLAWSVYDRITLINREKTGSATVAPGGSLVNDAVAVVGGLLIYAAMFKWGHALLIGVPLVR